MILRSSPLNKYDQECSPNDFSTAKPDSRILAPRPLGINGSILSQIQPKISSFKGNRSLLTKLYRILATRSFASLIALSAPFFSIQSMPS
jgi:hypothetical protein